MNCCLIIKTKLHLLHISKFQLLKLCCGNNLSSNASNTIRQISLIEIHVDPLTNLISSSCVLQIISPNASKTLTNDQEFDLWTLSYLTYSDQKK
jgi:hypothetical protein